MDKHKAEGHQYRSAPPEVWHAAIRSVPFNEMNPIAYKAVGKVPIIPGPDYMKLTGAVAKELYTIGKVCKPMSLKDAALPIFKMNLFFDSESSELWEMAQPANPYRSDMTIYGLDALFVANEDCIACKILLHDSNDSTGGSTDIGVVLLYDYGPKGFHAVPYVMDDEGLYFYDYESITQLSHWLGYLWRGVQYRMSNRPELVRVKHTRFEKETVEEAKKKTDGRKQIVKVQRIITMVTDEDTHVADNLGEHTITVPVWGVAGHWRTYTSGKCVWIKPYLKGKDRHNHDGYSPKEYVFKEESAE